MTQDAQKLLRFLLHVLLLLQAVAVASLLVFAHQVCETVTGDGIANQLSFLLNSEKTKLAFDVLSVLWVGGVITAVAARLKTEGPGKRAAEERIALAMAIGPCLLAISYFVGLCLGWI